LTGLLLVEFNALSNLVSFIPLFLESDQFKWRMSSSGTFSSHEIYNWLMFRGITDPKADIWWNLPIPLKIKMFMWLVMHYKILTRDNLCKR
jgi:zinc-binding in reverse transcriptase